MPKSDSKHFQDYTPQNQVKHKILGAYLPAYLHAVKNFVNGFHYIDGFAGCGQYVEKHDGSAVLAMKKIKGVGLLENSTLSLVENNPAYFEHLRKMVLYSPLVGELIEPPFFGQGHFTGFLEAMLSRDIYRKGKVATFAFIDPCGIDGVFVDDIIRLLEMPFGEVLLFFNYDAMNRVIGGVAADSHRRDLLDRIFGVPEIVSRLLSFYGETHNPAKKEQLIWTAFVAAIKQKSRARYFVPFKFKARNRRRTSHYLVHICSHHRGFTIMKDVMWGAGKDDTDDFGKLEFLSDRERGRQFKLFNASKDAKKREILKHLAFQHCKVQTFTKEWVTRPEDSFCESAYRMLLLELESEAKLEIFDKDNKIKKPASARPLRKGKPTLGLDYWLRIVS